jgi:putative Mg2+ transporter-C (MgtC) family protein
MPQFQFDPAEVISNFLRLSLAYLIAFPIGWDRERSARHFGLRTFPLVALVSCGYMLTALQVLDDSESRARLMQGLVIGIGFLGGGAIVKDKEGVRGTATAASIWNTGAIGMAVAWGLLEIAIMLGLVNFATLRLIRRFKRPLDHGLDTAKKNNTPAPPGKGKSP